MKTKYYKHYIKCQLYYITMSLYVKDDIELLAKNIDEINEIEPIGNETKIIETNVNPTEDINSVIEGLEILVDSSNDADKQELLEVIEGLKLLL